MRYLTQIEFCFAGGVLCARWYCVHINPVNSRDYRTAQLHSTTTVPVDQRRHHPAVPGTGGPVVYRRVWRETDLGSLWGGWTRAGLSPTNINLMKRFLNAHLLIGCTVVKAFLFIHSFVLAFSYLVLTMYFSHCEAKDNQCCWKFCPAKKISLW